MNRRFFVPLLVFALLAAACPQQQGDKNLKFKLQLLKFNGSKRYTEQRLSEASGLHVGDTVSGNSLQEVANVMGRTGAFSTISFRFNGAAAEFTTIDSPDVLPPSYDNILWFTDQELANGIRQRVPLFDGVVPAGGEMGLQIGHAIEAMLKEKGIDNAEVDVLPVSARPGVPPSSISFSVSNPRVEVAEVRLEGTAPERLAQMRKAIMALSGAEYKRSSTQSYVTTALKNVYRRLGFLTETVTGYEDAFVSTTPDTAKVALTVKVSEGKQYKVGAFHWAGSDILPAKVPEKLFALHPGEVANEDLLKVTLGNFGGAYYAKGYLKAHALASPQLDDNTQLVTYEVTVEPGAQYHVHSVAFRGMPDAQKDKLQQIFRLKPGDIADMGYLREFLTQKETLKVIGDRALEWNTTLVENVTSIDLTLQPMRLSAVGPQ